MRQLRDAGVSRSRHPTVRLPQERQPGEPFGDADGAVARSVIDDDDFDGPHCLRKHAFERGTEETFGVEGGDDDRNRRSHHSVTSDRSRLRPMDSRKMFNRMSRWLGMVPVALEPWMRRRTRTSGEVT